eukprot:ANDGO_02555.mRNA.1 hypothetical protein SPRG_11943
MSGRHSPRDNNNNNDDDNAADANEEFTVLTQVVSTEQNRMQKTASTFSALGPQNRYCQTIQKSARGNGSCSGASGLPSAKRSKTAASSSASIAEIQHPFLGGIAFQHGPSASAESRGARGTRYFQHRHAKLENQRPDTELYGNLIRPHGTASRLEDSSVPEKQEPERGDEHAPQKLLFEGIVGYFDGGTISTELSLYHLQKIFQVHGGSVVLYPLKRSTTHIFATNLASSKEDRARKSLTSAPRNAVQSPMVVNPRWITDCVRAGARLPEQSYRIIAADPKQRLLELPRG